MAFIECGLWRLISYRWRRAASQIHLHPLPCTMIMIRRQYKRAWQGTHVRNRCIPKPAASAVLLLFLFCKKKQNLKTMWSPGLLSSPGTMKTWLKRRSLSQVNERTSGERKKQEERKIGRVFIWDSLGQGRVLTKTWRVELQWCIPEWRWQKIQDLIRGAAYCLGEVVRKQLLGPVAALRGGYEGTISAPPCKMSKLLYECKNV